MTIPSIAFGPLQRVNETLSESPWFGSGDSVKNSFSHEVSLYLRIIDKKPTCKTSSGLQEMKGIFAIFRQGRLETVT